MPDLNDFPVLAPQQPNPAAPPQAVQDTVRALLGGAYGVMQHLGQLPQRAFEASEGLRTTGQYDPAPIVESAGLATGLGAPFAEEGALGAAGGRLSLQRTANPSKTARFATNLSTIFYPDSTSHFFDIMNEGGSQVGTMYGLLRDPRHFYVSNIYGKGAEQPNALGPSYIRSLISALRGEFPELEKISGSRMSGARAQAGTTGSVELKLPKAPK